MTIRSLLASNLSVAAVENDPKRTFEGTLSVRKNQTGRRTVREQSTLGVRNAPFRRANTAATVEDFALGPNLAGL